MPVFLGVPGAIWFWGTVTGGGLYAANRVGKNVLGGIDAVSDMAVAGAAGFVVSKVTGETALGVLAATGAYFALQHNKE